MNENIPAGVNASHKRVKPNSCLTKVEREEKLKLKRRLKFQRRVKKLKTRIKHAQTRRDTIIEKKAKLELTKLVSNEGEHSNVITGECDVESSTNEATKSFITSVSKFLFKYSDEQDPSIGYGKKQHQTEQAVKLLKHMTKGTQNASMFEDPSALWGYTRQKFNERANLLSSSLEKLRTQQSQIGDLKKPALTPCQEVIKARAWEMILAGHIKSACSIGCGPGNDTVGLISFLKSIADEAQCEDIKNSPVLTNVCFLDWTIKEWDTILNPLSGHLKEQKLVGNIESCFCDVTRSLNDNVNTIARNKVENMSIYLVSYLVSETRGKWEQFFVDLVTLAKSGSMFYFAEPTPWQLHRFVELCGQYLDILWIDSSMYFAEIQSLDKRLGPAVLFAMKK
jgi:hypothetical protein